MTVIIALFSALLSGAAFYFSTGLGSIWPLAWLAPVPVLWLAFRPVPGWLVFAAALGAGMLGAGNLLPAYAGTLPAVVLVTAIVLPGLSLAVSAIAARFVAGRVSAPLGAIVFAALWTACDYLLSLGPDGTALSPAYSQVGSPVMIQSAAVLGPWIVTFAIGLVAAGLAAALATKRALPAVLALIVAGADAGYGAWRLAQAPETPTVRVGLAADDAIVALRFVADRPSALAVGRAYAAAVRTLTAQNAVLIVLPERLAILAPEWRDAALADLETAARDGHATVVAGFDERAGKRRNVALIFSGFGPPQIYAKRRLVPGLEAGFVPGTASFMLGDGTAVAICKDMDFPRMLRGDARLAPTLFAVPAWDFGKDGWWHARLAIMRGVENGFAVARAANDGLLTLSDAYGRVLAAKPSATDGMATLIGEVPRGPGRTLYARVGDAFAWMCAVLAALLLGLAGATKRRQGV